MWLVASEVITIFLIICFVIWFFIVITKGLSRITDGVEKDVKIIDYKKEIEAKSLEIEELKTKIKSQENDYNELESMYEDLKKQNEELTKKLEATTCAKVKKVSKKK